MVFKSVMPRADLPYGSKRLPAPGRRPHLAVRQFLNIERLVAWDVEAAGWYANMRHLLVSTEQATVEMDMMIVAHSLSAGAVLLADHRRHYERIEVPTRRDNWA